MHDVLLVAATERELDGRDGLVCGVGPVEAAAATARALAVRDWAAVLHVGVAGGARLPAGSLVIGSEAVYLRPLGGATARRSRRGGTAARRGRERDPPGRSGAPDRDERRRWRPGRSARRGDGGLRRPPRCGARRRTGRRGAGRSRTRSASLTARAGVSPRRSTTLSIAVRGCLRGSRADGVMGSVRVTVVATDHAAIDFAPRLSVLCSRDRARECRVMRGGGVGRRR